MTNFNIQIISDTTCPWCYIGYRRLSRAIAAHKTSHPTDTFTLYWHAFYLNPEAPPYPGVEKKEYYDAKFGADRAAFFVSRIDAAGKEDGIAFKSGGKTGNTRDSHRVLWYAGQKEAEKGGDGVDGVQTRAAEELFRVYFDEGKNITDRGVLVEAAVAAGFERAEIETVLESGDGVKEVDLEAEKARRQLITGLPYFTVQGKYDVAGAKEPDAFLDIFDRVKRRE